MLDRLVARYGEQYRKDLEGAILFCTERYKNIDVEQLIVNLMDKLVDNRYR